MNKPQEKTESVGQLTRIDVGRPSAEMRWLETPRDKLVLTLQSSLYVGAKPASVDMVLEYCATAGLNVMLKPVHIVPMNVKLPNGKYEWRDVVMPGINHYRTQASRSGVYCGKSEPEWGPDIELKWGNRTLTVPAWCRITVKRRIGDYVAEFAAQEFWQENFATAGRDKDYPNAMWWKRPRGQLAKCTEAQALRMAFPEFASDATAEEMEGKVIDLTMPDADKPKAAIASLDQFAGKEPVDAEVEEVEEVEDAEEAEPEEVELPKMPAKHLKAFVEKGEFQGGWEWLAKTLPKVEGEARQELVNQHAALLWAVYNSDVKDKGPYSAAAMKMAKELNYVVPALEKDKGDA